MSDTGYAFFKEIRLTFCSFKPLIEAEEGASQEVVLDRLRNWGLQKLLREGYCMSGLHAFWLNRMSLGRRVAGFRFSGGNLPPNIFKYVVSFTCGVLKSVLTPA